MLLLATLLELPILRTLVIKRSEFAAVLLTIIVDSFSPPVVTLLLSVLVCANAFSDIWSLIARKDKEIIVDYMSIPSNKLAVWPFNIKANVYLKLINILSYCN